MSNNVANEALTRILLMQNMLGQLPGEQAIFEFVARGVSYMPGVASVDFFRGTDSESKAAPAHTDEKNLLRYPVQINNENFGELLVNLKDAREFEDYRGYIGNLCFMMAAVSQQFRRAEADKDRQRELAHRVSERTRQLASQVVETEAAMTQLNAEKERANRYLEVSEAIILELNHRGEIEVINRRGASLLGYQQDSLLGRNWFEIAIPTEIRDELKKNFDQAILDKQGAFEYFENEILTRDSERLFVAWHNVVLNDENEKFYRVLCSGIDITQRKQAETALTSEKERLAVTLRSIEDGVITTDNEGIILSLNRAAETLTGWLERDATGKPIEEVYQLEIFQRYPVQNRDDNSADMDTNDERNLFQWKLLSKNGDEAIVSHRQSPIHDHHSQKVGTVIVFRDMTRHVNLRDQLERVARLDSIGVLAGGIAHDFNNLLSGLFGYLEMAAGSDDIQQIRSLLQKSSSVFERAKHLTAQLLTFSKGGKPVLKVGNIAKTVKDAADFALSGSRIRCEFDIPDNVWKAEFDEHQIAQVIDNIVINAKQAMNQMGSIRVSICNTTIRERQYATLKGGNYVHISIHDSGGGIPADVRERIFDPFFTTREEGTGLGLSTSHSIIQKHGGAIDVESVVGEGTTVHLFLCASGDAVDQTSAHQPLLHEGKGIVLVLDDEEFLRDICSAMLHSMGYETQRFEDGPEVLAYVQSLSEAQKTEVAAGIFDLTIPGGTGGAEIVDAVRQELGDDIAIFAVSGYSAGDVMSHPSDFGFTDSLPKPFRKKNLSDLLEKHLHRGSDN